MKTLFLAANQEDYLSDSVLLGVRRLYGAACVDYPKAERLYAGYAAPSESPLYGRGFTLYSGILEDIKIDRSKIDTKLREGYYDRVIFGNIWSQYGLLNQWWSWLDPQRTIILDGADTPQVYPHAGLWWRRPSQWFAPRVHKGTLYYKREWTEDTQFNIWHRLLPRGLRKHLPNARNLRQISFSIPEEKILGEVPQKTKDFAVHCVDPEVASQIPGCKTRYAFGSESEYYADLQASRFAITTKRSGWDCMRHYEIAANGCIPCFRDLDKKPDTCAPHGLVDGVNCISYRTFDELFKKVNIFDPEVEATMRTDAITWARAHSCQFLAKKIVEDL